MTIDQLSNLIKDPNIFGYLIVRPFGLILLSLYNFVHNYGFAVILFALIVKLCCVPLAIKGKKSMLAMTALNAEMQQLQKKYANNRAKLNEEIQALYERRGVSPMSGCLPQFIPLPIMMGLYYAVQQPLQYIVGLSSETVIKLAQLVGLDNLAGANYTVQIVIAEKLNAFKDAVGNFSPDAFTKCLADGESIFPMDFHFFGLNLADTPSITHPGLIWIIPILSCLTAYPVQLHHAEDAEHAQGQRCGCEPDEDADHADAADVAVLCVHPSGRDRHLLDLQQRIHLRTGGHPDQAPPRQAGGRAGRRSRTGRGREEGQARGKPRGTRSPIVKKKKGDK